MGKICVKGKVRMSNGNFEIYNGNLLEDNLLFSISEGTCKLEEHNCIYYRIPSLIQTTKGTLLAFCDARYDTPDDNLGRISCVVRRSNDCGKTWSEPILVCKYPNLDGKEYSNVSRTMDTTALVTKSNKIFTLHGQWRNNTFNWSRAKTIPDTDWKAIISMSIDEGSTWTNTDISSLANGDIVSFLGGVGTGIQMENGTLVLPIDVCRRVNGQNKTFSSIIYSLDDGQSWNMPKGYAEEGTSECDIVEIKNGILLLNCRREFNNRGCYISNDMGETWKIYSELHNGISNNKNSSACQGSFIKIVLSDDRQVGLLSTPKNLNGGVKRDNLTLYATYDFNGWKEISVLYKENQSEVGGGYSSLCNAIDSDNLNHLFLLQEKDGDIVFRDFTNLLEDIASL